MQAGRPVWVDIENPPQVQYLVPTVQAFENAGRRVTVTARDAGMTLALLTQRGIEHAAVGGDPPAGRVGKVLAVAGRAASLRRIVGRARPQALVCAARPAAIAARLAGVPCFMICDYEYVDLGLFRYAGATVVHPRVIPAEQFRVAGFSAQRLIAFDGIKEDISFAGIDIDGVAAHDFGPDAVGLTRVLVRPPAEASHYFDPRSRASVLTLLDHLSSRDDVQTVFSPRRPSQAAYVAERRWRVPPIVLERPIPFVSLLKSVDRVVSAGGTMLREAAYLGVPAFSLFAGHLGAVDRHLRDSGRLTVIESPDQLALITAPAPAPGPFPRNPGVVAELVATVLARSAG
jgi:uncharacterized protein